MDNNNSTTVAGQANGTLGTTATFSNNPDGVFIDSNDNLYVSDTSNNRVQLWTNGASVGTLVAGTGRLQILKNDRISQKKNDNILEYIIHLYYSYIILQ
jgi:hypothetical protein